jgi:hypothetical protein
MNKDGKTHGVENLTRSELAELCRKAAKLAGKEKLQ